MGHKLKSGWHRVNGKGHVFCHCHIPDSSITSGIGIILISPIGPEYMFTYRTLRSLSERLADLGFHVLRYDHLGMGSSEFDLYRKDILSDWSESLSQLTDNFKSSYKLTNINHLCIRSGSIILTEYLKTNRTSNAIYWFPYPNGKSWVRDMEVMSNGVKDMDGSIDALGYPLTQLNAERISSLDLKKSSMLIDDKILLIEDSASLPNKSLHEALSNQADFILDRMEGMKELLNVVSYSKVPRHILDQLCGWLTKNSPSLDDKSLDNASSDNDSFISSTFSNSQFSESVYNSSEGSIFGITTKPNNQEIAHMVVLVNAGSGHQVGPNRINVFLARSLAKLEIASIRIDLKHLGDSASYDESSQLNPFVINKNMDIDFVIKDIDKLYNVPITLVGLCSGAHNQFHAALNSQSLNIKQLVLINPINFYYRVGQSFEASDVAREEVAQKSYQQNFANSKKWISLLKNPRKILSIIATIFRIFNNKFISVYKKISSKLGVKNYSQLDKDLLSLVQRHINIHLICSDSDPGIQIISKQAPLFKEENIDTDRYKVISIPNSNHNFTDSESMNQLLSRLSELLRVN